MKRWERQNRSPMKIITCASLSCWPKKTDHLHVAMFPIDPRLGKEYMRGAKQFVSRIHTAYFFPMHFGEQYEKANRFGETAAQYGCRYMPVSQPGQIFTLI